MRQKCFCIITFIFLLFPASFVLLAQGHLSGSFETNSVYYFNDTETGAMAPENRLGSNNYAKLDYLYNKFRAGVQYEAYLPVLQGLPTELNGNALVFKYASFEDKNLSVTAGDFYEQFGNGLILRAYEERSLGLNTSVEGVNIAYSFDGIAQIKGIVGRPRQFLGRAESTIKGASLNINIASVLGLENFVFTAEANYLNRYQLYAGQAGIDPNVNAYSVRGNWAYGGFNLQGEYAYKTKDPSAYNNNLNKDGSALLVELGYTAAGFGSLLSFRRLEYMQFGTSRGIAGIGRDLNYLPALTRQYSYSLANLNPHNAMGNSEIGGQLDIQYRIKRGSLPGGRYGTKIALNASTYYSLKGDAATGYRFLDLGDTRYYQDINIDLEKRLNSSLKLLLLYSNQVYNPVVTGKENTLYFSQIVVGDLLWEVNNAKSFRFELQHLRSKDYYKNWVAALLEFNISPQWSCYVADMYNYGDTNIHYYSGGFSYTESRTRVAFNYGRNREGVICTGGVCLFMPAYTGFNLSVTISF